MSLAKHLLRKLRMVKARTSTTTTSPRTAYPVVNVATPATAASPLRSPSSSSSTRDDDLLLRRVFSEFDKNGDGRISAAELGQVAHAIASLDEGLVEADAAAVVAALDMDGDGSIDFHEFTACLSVGAAGPASSNAGAAPGSGEPCSSREEDAECLRSAFAVYDRNGDGVITAEELQLVLGKLMMGNGNNATSLADCKKMIRAVDRNGDGVVSFQEFVAMMTPRAAAGSPVPL